ncbi:MAG: universal stress protein, partial [Bacteroidota bacterium]
MKNPSSFQFRRLLVPVDFSDIGMAAALYAIQLAASCDARVILFHSVHLPVLAGDELVHVAGMNELEQESSLLLDRLRMDLIGTTGYSNVTCLSVQGLAADRILDIVKEESIDLVVMGTGGANGWGGQMLGTNTSELSAHCGCPVLVIPAGVLFKHPERVLFLTDYADNDFQSIFLL